MRLELPRYKGRPVGSFGHMTAFSFCQDKIMTTGGEGGMLVLDDEEAWKRAWAYKGSRQELGRGVPPVSGKFGAVVVWFVVDDRVKRKAGLRRF
jgi:dTDP-4-amino-4,6-dideoxygalactose transaminase